MKKKEPDFNSDTSNIEKVDMVEDEVFSMNFVGGLINNFASGAVDYLEAKRFIETNNPKNEVELIANDEQIKSHRKQIYFDRKILD